MTVLATYTFDGLTDNAALVTPSGLSQSGDVPTVRSASAIHGNRGIRWNGGIAGRLTYDFGTNQGVIVASGYFNITTMSAAHMYMAAIYSLATGGVQQGDWRINLTTNTVTIRNVTTAVGTSSYVILPGTDYRWEWKIIEATDTQELKIFLGEGTTPVVDLTSSGWTGALNRAVHFGPYTGAAGFDVDHDTLRIADDWVGPYSVGTTPPDVSNAQVDAAVVTATGTAGSGGSLSYGIAQTSGPTVAAVNISSGKWYIPRHPTSTLVYTITVTESPSGLTDTTTVTIDPTPTGSDADAILVRNSGNTAWV